MRETADHTEREWRGAWKRRRGAGASAFPFIYCGRGGTGRHAGFRIQWRSSRAGSSPAVRTKNGLKRAVREKERMPSICIEFSELTEGYSAVPPRPKGTEPRVDRLVGRVGARLGLVIQSQSSLSPAPVAQLDRASVF